MRLKRLWWLLPAALPVAAAGWLFGTAGGLAWAWGRAVAWAPGTLTATQVNGRLAGPLHIDGLHYRETDFDLSVDSVALDWRPWALLRGELHLTGMTMAGGIATVKGGTTDGTAPTFHWPLALRIDQGSIRHFTVNLPEQAPLVINSADLSGRLAAGPGRSSDLHLKWTLTYSGRPVAGAGTLTGSFYTPTATAHFTAPFAATTRVTVAWRAAPLRWQGEADLPPLALNTLDTSWPAVTAGGHIRFEGRGATVTLEGDGRLAAAAAGRWHYHGRLHYGDDGWQLPSLTLRSADGQGEVKFAGAWPGPGRPGRLSAQWHALALPTVPGWRFSGKLDAAGLPDAYRGSFALAAAGRVPVQAKADFSGNEDGLTLSALNGRGLDGRWQGDGVLHWRDGLHWRTQLSAAGVDPGQLDPRWHGRVGGKVTASGEDASVQVAALDVDGELAGRRFKGTAAGDYGDGRLTLRRLALRAGQARFTASGYVGRSWDLAASLKAPQLGDLLPGAGGSVDLAGRLHGTLRRPRLYLDGDARQVVAGAVKLGAARLHADIDLAGKAPWALKLALDDAVAAPLRLTAGRLQLIGSAASHRVTLDARFGDGTRLTVAATGGWSGDRWRGRLNGGSLEMPGQPAWRADPAQLEVSSGGGSLQRWCWRGGGHLCAALQSAGGHWDGALELTGLSMALLQRWLPRPELTLGGTLQAALTVQGTASAVTRLTAHADVAGGKVSYVLPDGPVETALRSAEFDASGDAAGLKTRLSLTLTEGGGADARLELPGWLPGQPLAATLPVHGGLRLQTDRLDWLTYFVPALLRPSGRLDAHIELGGSVGAPALSGRVALRDGAVRLPLSGIALSDITLDGDSTDGRQLSLTGSARSGPGRLALKGRLFAERLGRWRVETALKGETFELLRLAQARVLVSPDLHLAVQEGRVEVRGVLTVPEANINLPQLPNTVTVSPDTVVVDAPAQEAAARRWRMDMDLRLAAGDKVRLHGYGFTGRLTGAVTIKGETPGITHAQGELRVEDGRYQAYGQNLTIQRGRLLFVDSPPDNPGLDVRAVRSLPDQNGIVGVEVSGRLKQPRLRIFSDPTMSENEALAWLVLGRPLNSASRSEADVLYHAAFSVGGESAARGIALQFGLDEVSVESGTSTDQLTGTTTNQSSVVLGKYLSPQLYLQYAVGLWNTANQLRIRYRLSPHWTLKMEQGDQSGADFLYSIER